MSKLAIILCAILSASAASGSYVSEKLDGAHNNVNSLIQSSITEVTAQFDTARQKAYDTVANLEKSSSEYREKVFAEVSTNFANAQNEIQKFTSNVEGADITECTLLVRHLDYTARSAITNMSNCVSEKRKTADNYIQEMVKISDNVRRDLTALRVEARHCIDDDTSYASGFVCLNYVAIRVPWTAGKAAPWISWNLARLTYLLTTLPPSLAYCSATHGVTAFYHESSNIIDRTKKCVQQKIEEYRNAAQEANDNDDSEPKVHHTAIETVHPSDEIVPTTEMTDIKQEPPAALPTEAQSSNDETEQT